MKVLDNLAQTLTGKMIKTSQGSRRFGKVFLSDNQVKVQAGQPLSGGNVIMSLEDMEGLNPWVTKSLPRFILENGFVGTLNTLLKDNDLAPEAVEDILRLDVGDYVYIGHSKVTRHFSTSEWMSLIRGGFRLYHKATNVEENLEEKCMEVFGFHDNLLGKVAFDSEGYVVKI